MLPRVHQRVRIPGFPVLFQPAGLVRSEAGHFKSPGNVGSGRPLPAVRNGRHPGHSSPLQGDLHAGSMLNALDDGPGVLLEFPNAHLVHTCSVFPK